MVDPEFPRGETITLFFGSFITENCIKMKETWPRGGGGGGRKTSGAFFKGSLIQHTNLGKIIPFTLGKTCRGDGGQRTGADHRLLKKNGGCGFILVGEKFAGEHFDLWWLCFDFSWREVCRGTYKADRATRRTRGSANCMSRGL